jgi:hypothetical protein
MIHRHYVLTLSLVKEPVRLGAFSTSGLRLPTLLYALHALEKVGVLPEGRRFLRFS